MKKSKIVRKIKKIEKRKERKKDKTLIIGIIVLGIIIIIALAGTLTKQEQKLYKAYQQECRKEEGYFEDISKVKYGGDINRGFIQNYKKNSTYCNTSEAEEMTKLEFEDFKEEYKCKAYAWEGRRYCSDGWELEGKYCYSGNYVTYSLIACSLYKCEDNYYVEVN